MKARVLSFGAGVQSSTLLMMSDLGELAEKVDAAIFADTQWEPPAIYDHIAWVTEQVTIPVHVVTTTDLRAKTKAREGYSGHPASLDIPAFVLGVDGKKGMVQRQCTSNYKIRPIRRKVREILGLGIRNRLPAGQVVEQWLGISTDEAHRVRDSDVQWIINRYPLIEAGMSRSDCLDWWSERYPDRPLVKSSCMGCPYQSSRRWVDTKRQYPDHFAELVAIDANLREPGWRKDYGQVYLHASRIPLDEAVAATEAQQTYLPETFGNECHGVCGV